MNSVSAVRRAGLGILCASGLIVGGWALFLPRSFYDDFPGLGRHWVSAAGAYNEHLVTDVGAAYLALAAAAALAFMWADQRSCRLAGIVWAVFSAPHLYFHTGHLHGLATIDVASQLGLLAGTLVIALLLAVPERRNS